MDIWIIITILLFIILIAIIFKTIKKLFLAIMLVNVLLLIFFLVIGFFLYSDFANLKEGLSTKSNLFLLEKDETLLGGFVMEGEKEPVFLNRSGLKRYQNRFMDRKYDEVDNQTYKFIVVKVDSFAETLPNKIDFQGQIFSKDEVLNVLDSNKPIELFVNISSKGKKYSKIQLDAMISKMGDPLIFKAQIFMYLYGKKFDEEGPKFLIEQYKKGNIIIYPKTAIFRSLDLIPMVLINNALKDIEKR